MPRLSVIMGVYNTDDRDMLYYSIRSVLGQSFTDFEFIICDDGSTDQTFARLQELAVHDCRIRLLRNECNLGLAATLNRCLKEAKGDYIARQDADDFSVPNRFIEQVAFLDNNSGAAFVGSSVALFDENGVWGQYKLKEFPNKEDFLFTVPIMHASVVFRKSALLAVNGYRVAPETRRAEDYDLFMRMYAAGFYAANLQQQLYHVRENKAALRRRKYCYRIDDAIVRYKGFKALGLFWRGIPFILKPLIVGLIPAELLGRLKNVYYHRKQDN